MSPVANDVCDEELNCTVKPNRCQENSSQKHRSSDSPLRDAARWQRCKTEGERRSPWEHWERSARGSSRQYLPISRLEETSPRGSSTDVYSFRSRHSHSRTSKCNISNSSSHCSFQTGQLTTSRETILPLVGWRMSGKNICRIAVCYGDAEVRHLAVHRDQLRFRACVEPHRFS
jgi:hypothetical protein